MLERDAVVEAIEQLLDQTRRRRGGALFVIGEAGLGRTSILDHARGLAASAARVGQADGDVLETAVPFGLIAQAIEDLSGRGVLEEGVTSSSPEDARASQVYRAFRWLEDLAASGPLMIAVDDLHWSDPDSLVLLSYLCRRITDLPVAVVATLRPWPPGAEEMCLSLAEEGHAQVERLHPLSEEAARELLTELVGRRLPSEVLRNACTASAGNPLLLAQAALAINKEGTSGEDRGAPVPVAESLRLRRFAGLPEVGVLCARAASVFGRRFPPELATSVARLDEGEAELALESLSRTGLVRPVGVGLAEFTHPLFRQALYHDLPPLVREELHARAFRLLLERGMEGDAALHAGRGNLLGDAEAVGVLARAGQAALRTGAVSTALEHLERAATLAGERPGPDVLLPLGEALLAEGRAKEAASTYERVLDQTDNSDDTTTEALRMLGRSLFLTGDVVRGEQRFEEAAALALGKRPEVAVRAVLDLSRAAWLTEGPAGALPATARARDLARQADDACRAQAEAAWGFVAFMSGDPDGLDASAAAGQGEAVGTSVLRDLYWNWGTFRNSGRAAKYAERFAHAESVFSAMFAHAERMGSPHSIVSLAAHHADTLARQGRLDQALALTARATTLADLAPTAAAFAHVVEALLLLHLDRPEESEDSCQRAEHAATSRGQWLPLLRVWHVRALRHLHEGGFDEACELYTRLEAKSARLGIAEPCLVPWARAAITAFVGHGDPDHAERIQGWVEDRGRRLPCRWPRIAAYAGRATLAAAEGEHSTADAQFRAALALHAEVELPLERVETRLQWGAHLRRTGRVRDARDALREALAEAEQTGSRWLARRVQDELAVARGRRSRKGSSPGLTPQEQRVAALAASGRSGPEIARQLSLSTRTIETHLGRIYAKLGIHSQRELISGYAGQQARRENT